MHLPEMEDFWYELAHEEHRHALQLRSLHQILDRKHLFHGLGHFNTEAFRAFVDRARKVVEAGDKELTPRKALAMALAMERSVIEADFYKKVTSTAPEFRAIADHLAGETARHVKRVEDKLREYITRETRAAGAADAPGKEA